jgi:hypothetical protein
MGRASQRKKLPASERRSPPRGTRPFLGWWLGALAVVVVGLIALVGFHPGTASNSDGGPPATDQTSFATTGGEMSLANLKGSKVILYFYEGAG